MVEGSLYVNVSGKARQSLGWGFNAFLKSVFKVCFLFFSHVNFFNLFFILPCYICNLCKLLSCSHIYIYIYTYNKGSVR